MPHSLVKIFEHALSLHQQGKLTEAAQGYQQILKINARHFDALKLLATIHAQCGAYDKAIAGFEKAIEINPNVASLYNNLGIALKELGREQEALSAYEKAIALDKNFAQAFFNKAVLLQKQNNHLLAVNAYTEAIQRNPNYADAFINRGNVHGLMKNQAQALNDYQAALKINPVMADAYYNVGNVLCEMNDFSSALGYFSKCIELNGHHEAAHFNLANTLVQLNRHQEAIGVYRDTLKINPRHADAWYNLGNILHQSNSLEEALSAFENAIKINPDYRKARWNKSLVLLHMGRYEAGWVDYEIRWQTGPQAGHLTERKERRWLGQENISGKRLLLVGEQGLGDVIQFSRYALDALKLGAQIGLEVPAELKTLLSGMHQEIQVFTPEQAHEQYDYFCPLMSLPAALGIDVSQSDSHVPYLHADPVKTKTWRGQLPQNGQLNIGLVWSGGHRPNHPEIWDVNARRNMPIRYLENLVDLKANWISLQKGEPAESEYQQLIASGWQGPHLQNEMAQIHDFSDTAALVASLDLVISVDTATAHLAAAMGKPVWLLNRFDSCWRWLRDQKDSAWYPSLRIYRQPNPGDWDSVMQTVKQDLNRWIISRA